MWIDVITAPPPLPNISKSVLDKGFNDDTLSDAEVLQMTIVANKFSSYILVTSVHIFVLILKACCATTTSSPPLTLSPPPDTQNPPRRPAPRPNYKRHLPYDSQPTRFRHNLPDHLLVHDIHCLHLFWRQSRGLVHFHLRHWNIHRCANLRLVQPR